MHSTDATRLRAYILTDNAQVPCEVVDVHSAGLTVRAKMEESIGPDIRVGFVHEGDHPGRIQLLGSILEVRFEVSAVRFVVDQRSLHTSDGRACLDEFLATVLHRPSSGGRVRGSNHSGWFYDFLSAPAAGPVFRTRQGPREAKVMDYDPVAANKAARVMLKRLGVTGDHHRTSSDDEAVRIKLGTAVHIDGENHRGTAYRISRDGAQLHVRAACAPPSTGDTIGLMTTVRLYLKSYRVFVIGEATWVLNESSKAGECAFGLAIDPTSDADSLQTLKEFAEIESAVSADVALAGDVDDTRRYG